MGLFGWLTIIAGCLSDSASNACSTARIAS